MSKTVPVHTPSIQPPVVAIEPRAGPHIADWNLLRSFLAIYETGTLTLAAKRLGSTQPNMGRHLRELEGVMGETLFVRRPGKLGANEHAHQLFLAVAPMAHAIRDAERVFTDGRSGQGDRADIVGVVRVAVSELFGYYVMPKILAAMLHDQPQLEIELSVSNLTDNLLRRDADIAVRFFRPEQRDIIVYQLGEVTFGLYAHKDYIEKFGEPEGYEIPVGGFLTGFDKEPFPLAEALRDGPPSAPLRFRFRSDFTLARQAIVECGGGIGMMQTDIAATRPGLRRVLADQVELVQPVWLCAHDELRRSLRMRYVWDRLKEGIEARLASAL